MCGVFCAYFIYLQIGALFLVGYRVCTQIVPNIYFKIAKMRVGPPVPFSILIGAMIR